ncbi:MAG: DUF115 domain-containing protein [Acidobacteriota bacterium]|nr:DUF115 domain-containing protein [Acidobacteriota bacterium]
MRPEEANRVFFETYDPQFLEEFGAWEQSPAVIQPGRKGSPTMSIDDRFVHSSYDPLKEALKAAGKSRSYLHIHLGFGLGYLVDADHTQPGGCMVILEPDRRILSAALHRRELGSLLRERNARICCTLERFRSLIFAAMKPNHNFKLAALPYHARHYSKLWQQLPDLARRTYGEVVVTHRTIRKVTPGLTRGALRALPFTTQLPGVEQLTGCLAGKPAVVVAAGPSLDKNLPDLAAVADRCVVIALGRTAKPLEKWGVNPDFLVHNEPKPFFQFIAGCKNLAETAFVLSGQADLDYYRHRHGPTFVTQNITNFTGRWICGHFPQLQRGYLETAGSVANEAFSLAVLLGCNPIILTGQDLAVKGEQYYGHAPTNQSFAHGREDERWVPGYFDGNVKTMSTWEGYLHWFEREGVRQQKRNPNLILINATEGGASIEGFQAMKLREVIHRFFKQPFDTRAIVHDKARVNPDTCLPPEKLKALAAEYRERLNLVYQLDANFQPLADKLSRLLKKFRPDRLKQLQQHLEMMEQFKDAYAQTQEGFLVLSGFMQDALLDIEQDRRELAAHPPEGDELTVFLTNTRNELAQLRATFKATIAAADQLAPLLEDLAGKREEAAS